MTLNTSLSNDKMAKFEFDLAQMTVNSGFCTEPNPVKLSGPHELVSPLLYKK